MRSMSSKERVLAALGHQEPDRIPINYMANSGIDEQLKSHFGIASHDDESLLERLGVDMREISIPYTGRVLHAPRKMRDIDPAWGITKRWIAHESGGYWDYCDFPLASLDAELIESWKMPNPDDYDYSSIDTQLLGWKDKAICVGNPGLADIMNTTGMLCGMAEVYLAMAMGNESWLRLVERRLEVQLEVTRRALERAKGAIDYMWIGEDLGAQSGPLISLDTYRTLLRPKHQMFIDLAASYDIPVMIHSCGSSSWAFDDFIDMGISAVDTLQPEAKDMAPSYLKSTYGKDLAFHGGFSTAGKVVDGTTEEVMQELQDLLSVMMPGGGYLFSPTHMLQDNSSCENVLAVYEALPIRGRY